MKLGPRRQTNRVRHSVSACTEGYQTSPDNGSEQSHIRTARFFLWRVLQLRRMARADPGAVLRRSSEMGSSNDQILEPNPSRGAVGHLYQDLAKAAQAR